MYAVYILASGRHGTLYVGATNNLARRVWEHKSKAVPGFTQTYGVDRLVYYEVSESMEAARLRERQLKRWRHSWKIALIEENNPEWRDLYELLEPSSSSLT